MEGEQSINISVSRKMMQSKNIGKADVVGVGGVILWTIAGCSGKTSVMCHASYGLDLDIWGREL